MFQVKVNLMESYIIEPSYNLDFKSKIWYLNRIEMEILYIYLNELKSINFWSVVLLKLFQGVWN